MKTNDPKNSTETIHSRTIGKLSKIFAVLLSGLFLTMGISAQTTTFPGTGFGPIPDGGGNPNPSYGQPRVISFNVTGMTAPLKFIEVNLALTHSFAGDLDMVLTAPDGTTSVILASRIGATTATGFGDSSNFGGTYTFTDFVNAENIWTIATDQGCGTDCVINPSLFYRTTGGGGAGQTNPPPITDLTATFANLTTNRINGTWTVTIRDGASGDIGEVTSAGLLMINPLIVTKIADTDDGVCNTDCSLREAISAASNGGSIGFSDSLFSSPQTITLTNGQLGIFKSLTITGTGANLLTITPVAGSRVFDVAAGNSFNISGMKLSGANAPALFGGAIINNGTMSITNSTISNNSADLGGGVRNQSGGTMSITNSTISNNSANVGGGIYNDSGTMTILNSDINNNSAKDGGGINNNNGTLTVTNSTISYNSAVDDAPSSQALGGGINTSFGTLNVNNTTISNNLAFSGGGIRIFSNGSISDSTISNNSATAFGGGLFYFDGTMIVSNSIIANNTATFEGPDIQNTLNSNGYNLIGNTANTVIEGNETGNQYNIDPMLAPLGNYGGTTKTHALLQGSPAIDAGNRSGAGDQRGNFLFDFPGVENVTDGSDIGAFERQPNDFSGTSTRFDLDGDNKTDIGIFRPAPGEWWYLRSSDGGNRAFQFGQSTDMNVTADYTGDGKSDIAFFRPSTGSWFILRSEDGSFYSFPFGLSTDIPAPADYDSDAQTRRRRHADLEGAAEVFVEFGGFDVAAGVVAHLRREPLALVDGVVEL